MACFIVPAAEAVVVTAVKKVEEKKAAQHEDAADENVIPFVRKLKWLQNMLIGGVVLLAFEHLWHGEVVPFFPFLTAMSDPGETAEMLREMATVGTTMAALITVVWIGMCIAADAIVKRQVSPEEAHATVRR